MTQVLYYLGDLASAGTQPAVDLDMAKHQLDTLGMLEDKTKNNLTPEETKLLDAAAKPMKPAHGSSMSRRSFWGREL